MDTKNTYQRIQQLTDEIHSVQQTYMDEIALEMSKTLPKFESAWFIFNEEKQLYKCTVNDGNGKVILEIPIDSIYRFCKGFDAYILWKYSDICYCATLKNNNGE